jgi:hypothetical protein
VFHKLLVFVDNRQKRKVKALGAMTMGGRIAPLILCNHDGNFTRAVY